MNEEEERDNLAWIIIAVAILSLGIAGFCRNLPLGAIVFGGILFGVFYVRYMDRQERGDDERE